MNSLDKVIRFGLGSAVIGLAVVAAPEANALSFFTFEQQFEDGVLTGSFSVDPEFGNIELSDLETFNAKFDGSIGVVEWEKGDLDLFQFFNDQYLKFDAYSSEGDCEDCGREDGLVANDDGYDNARRDIVVVEVAPPPTTAVPTPAAVLPGLFGMSLSAIRKRRVASSEEA